MRAVNKFFSKKGLWRYLDYDATGKTFEQGGLIIVDIVFYTEEAMRYCDKVKDITIDLGADNKNLAFSFLQILAEEKHEVVTTDMRKVIQELEALNASSWQKPNDVDVIITQKTRRSSTPIYMANNTAPKPQKIPLSLTLDTSMNKKHPELLPLFAVVAEIILQNISYRIGLKHGLYVDKLTNKAGVCTTDLLILKRRASELNPGEITAFAKSVQKEVTAPTTLERIGRNLQSVDYQTRYYEAPNYENILKNTGILIGQKGWHHIATTENIRLLLDHSTLEIKIGRRRSSYRIRS